MHVEVAMVLLPMQRLEPNTKRMVTRLASLTPSWQSMPHVIKGSPKHCSKVHAEFRRPTNR